MHKPRGLLKSTAILSSLALGGCASYQMTRSAPPESKPIAISYTGDDISAWSDMPIGTYHVPDSQVIISGHQRTGPASMMFGLAGVAVANAIDKSGGKSAVKSSEDVLHITLTSEAQDNLKGLLASNEFAGHFTTSVTRGDPELSISGSIVLTFIDETSVTPFVVLKATLKQHNRNKEIKDWTLLWSTRYVCSIGAAKPLAGAEGWVSDDGVALRSTISAELKQAMHYMLSDIVAPAPRDDAHRILVSGHYPFIKGRFEMVGYALGDDGNSVVFSPKIGDATVLAGVDIFDKTTVTYRDAIKDDKIIKRIQDPEKP
jgi:hypothetical protein